MAGAGGRGTGSTTLASNSEETESTTSTRSVIIFVWKDPACGVVWFDNRLRVGNAKLNGG